MSLNKNKNKNRYRRNLSTANYSKISISIRNSTNSETNIITYTFMYISVKICPFQKKEVVYLLLKQYTQHPYKTIYKSFYVLLKSNFRVIFMVNCLNGLCTQTHLHIFLSKSRQNKRIESCVYFKFAPQDISDWKLLFFHTITKRQSTLNIF